MVNVLKEKVEWEGKWSATYVGNRRRASPSSARPAPSRCIHAAPCSTPRSTSLHIPTLSRSSPPPPPPPSTPPPSSAPSARSAGPARSTAAPSVSTTSTPPAPRPRSTASSPTASGRRRSPACSPPPPALPPRWWLSSSEDWLRASEKASAMCLCRTSPKETLFPPLMLAPNHVTDNPLLPQQKSYYHYTRKYLFYNICFSRMCLSLNCKSGKKRIYS